MGAWGPGIFSDDLACDVRQDYRDLLEDQAPDEEATRRLIEAFDHLAEDEVHVLWLALAATQSRLGRLGDHVRAKALEVIDTGEGLDRWEEAGSRSLASRRAALEKLRTQLTGPQPARKPVRRPWRYVTDLEPGDVLAFTASNGRMVLFKVARIADGRDSASPILQRLDWVGETVPGRRRLSRLRVLARGASWRPEPRPVVHHVGRGRKKDPDWCEVSFALVAKLPTTAEDAQETALSYTHWTGLSSMLEYELVEAETANPQTPSETP